MASSPDSPSPIFERYPNLRRDGYEQTSDPTPDDGPSPKYNCVAFALGETDRVVSHAPGDYWPAKSRLGLLRELVEVFGHHGFEPCKPDELTPGSVALYARNDFWKHAARKTDDGKWTSKLGVDGEDIAHATPECVLTDGYGGVCCFMRPKTA